MARILIIDDDESIRSLLQLMLERIGHTTEVAANGREGLEKIREAGFDLVITDLIMPEKEGIKTIQELRRTHPALKIIAMSGGGRIGSHDYLPLARLLGASRTLPKPFDSDQLAAAVTEVLG